MGHYTRTTRGIKNHLTISLYTGRILGRGVLPCKARLHEVELDRIFQ